MSEREKGPGLPAEVWLWKGAAGIDWCSTKDSADEVADYLRRRGTPSEVARYVRASPEQEERAKLVEAVLAAAERVLDECDYDTARDHYEVASDAWKDLFDRKSALKAHDAKGER